MPKGKGYLPSGQTPQEGIKPDVIDLDPSGGDNGPVLKHSLTVGKSGSVSNVPVGDARTDNRVGA